MLTKEGAEVMAVFVIMGLLFLGMFLLVAGSVEIERRAENWARYEKWMHPPDDDDGVSTIGGDSDENN